jgi:ribosomal protein L11 methyltransferase
MPLWTISARLDRSAAVTLAEAVMERDGVAVSASAHELPDSSWMFEANCEGEPNIDAFAALAREVTGAEPAFETAPVPEIDWVRKSLEGLRPVRSGRFWIHGAHDAGRAPPGTIPILIDAGQAFGTGHHASTSLCLEAFTKLLREGRPRNVLDLGCGSGVLAIAAAKTLRRTVVASDVDPVAVEVAAENARINGVDRLVKTFVADGISDARLRGPYDLVFANILAEPLRRLAPALARQIRPGGAVILSGFLDEQESRLAAAYAVQGFAPKAKATRAGWVALTLCRK